MILCHCALVSDRVVRRAVSAGAASLEALAATCGGAGAACGGCRRSLRSLLAACIAGDAEAAVGATPVQVASATTGQQATAAA
jgi:bacterioferritin-associated ferredoxin